MQYSVIITYVVVIGCWHKPQMTGWEAEFKRAVDTWKQIMKFIQTVTKLFDLIQSSVTPLLKIKHVDIQINY